MFYLSWYVNLKKRLSDIRDFYLIISREGP